MAYLSPLRYPGGKAKLAPWMAELLLFNKLKSVTYIEPYVGGAGVALYLLMNKIVERIVINDIDPAIYAIWYSILYHTDDFIKKVIDVKVNIQTWEMQKEIVTNPKSYSLFELGFAAFFLNRTNISGVIQGGPIGGKEQKGKFKIDARFNKEELVKRVELIAQYKTQIDIFNKDAIDILSLIENKRKCFVYLDPPYYKKGSQLYRNHYKIQDHLKIALKVKKLQSPWLLTYDNCEEIKNLYSDCDGLEFTLRYSASRKRVASELMYYGNIKLHCHPGYISSKEKR